MPHREQQQSHLHHQVRSQICVPASRNQVARHFHLAPAPKCCPVAMPHDPRHPNKGHRGNMLNAPCDSMSDFVTVPSVFACGEFPSHGTIHRRHSQECCWLLVWPAVTSLKRFAQQQLKRWFCQRSHCRLQSVVDCLYRQLAPEWCHSLGQTTVFRTC